MSFNYRYTFDFPIGIHAAKEVMNNISKALNIEFEPDNAYDGTYYEEQYSIIIDEDLGWINFRDFNKEFIMSILDKINIKQPVINLLDHQTSKRINLLKPTIILIEEDDNRTNSFGIVKPSSIPNEYYLGGLPGQLHSSKDNSEILDAELATNEDTCGYTFCEHSLENLRRLTPYTQQHIQWKILLIMKKENQGEIWLKGALLNNQTKKVALITSTNNINNLESRGNRGIRTLDNEWFVGHYRMSAPIIFWSELKNRLLY
jgi:hypothetical protein